MPERDLLLIVEDDASFAETLKRSFKRRGYDVIVADGPEQMKQLTEGQTPTHAVVDLKLGTASGLTCVEALYALDPQMRIVVLTGYASIGTAVEAIKLGACHYLAKPSNTDDIEAAFNKVGGDSSAPVAERQTNFKTLEWEMIHRTLAEADFNISETARRLGMHRRTLARKLEKSALTRMVASARKPTFANPDQHLDADPNVSASSWGRPSDAEGMGGNQSLVTAVHRRSPA